MCLVKYPAMHTILKKIASVSSHQVCKTILGYANFKVRKNT